MTSSSSSSPEIPAAPSSTKSHDRFSYKHASHEEVLEDLSSRFILNLPDEEFGSLERICFQVEQAHWFYEDFIREENPKFPSLPLKKFSAMLFHACPLLRHWSDDHERAFTHFMQYKTRVPVCGAIMLNETWEKCLLVKGWKSSSGWGFPKGKINEGEPEHLCAIREVLEETGYNLAGQLNPEDVIQMSIKEQTISLYIVPDVPEDFEFETRTRKEISRIEWFKLTDLPTWKRNKAAPGKFYLISPFIGQLKAFISARKPPGVGKKTPKSKFASITQSDAFHDPSLGCTQSSDQTQESSSQSSSVDNGDPQTPSPRYGVSHNHIVTAVVDDPLDPKTLDPHFARLLSSLSMSANAISDRHADDEHFSPAVKPTAPPVTSATPVQTQVSSAEHHRYLNGLHAPAKPSAPLLDRIPNAPATLVSSSPAVVQSKQSSVTPVAPAAANPHPPSVPFSGPRSPVVNRQTGRAMSHEASGSFSSASTVKTSDSPSTPSSRSKSSRRVSGTADISPYLSRLSEVPTSGKRLKQLALLESVADESVKMAPKLWSKSITPNLPLNCSQANAHPLPPPPPATVPPPNAMAGLHPMYSSASVHGQMAALHSRPLPCPPGPFSQIRPQSSLAILGDSGARNAANHLDALGSSQRLLLSTINGHPGASYSSGVQGYSPTQQQPQQPLSAQYQRSLNFATHSSLQQSFIQASTGQLPLPPYSTSASQFALSPQIKSLGFASPTHSVNGLQTASSLLSILNGGLGSRAL